MALQDILNSISGGAPPAVDPNAPGTFTAPGAANIDTGIGPGPSSQANVLASLRSRAQQTRDALQRPTAAQPAQPFAFSGVPDVKGMDRGSAFMAGLAGGIRDSGTNSQIAAQQATLDQQNRLAFAKAAYDMGRQTDQDKLNAYYKTPAYLKLAATAQQEAKPDETKVQVIGEDQMGNKKYGYFDDKGNLVPAKIQGDQGLAADATGTPLSGQAFLDTLDPGAAASVKAIAEGRASMTGRNLQKYLPLVSQYELGFQQADYATRLKTRNDFNGTGIQTAGGQIQSGNTALNHLSDLSDAAEALNNSQFPLVNRMENAVQGQLGTSTALTHYNDVLDRYVHETGRFYKGGAPTNQDILTTRSNLDPNQSPQQLREAIASEAQLLQGKTSELQNKWMNAMGPRAEPWPILTSDAQARIAKIAQRAHPESAPAPGGPTLNDINTAAVFGPQGGNGVRMPGAQGQPAPQPAMTLPPAALATLKEGHGTTFGNGQTWTLQNGQPVQVQ